MTDAKYQEAIDDTVNSWWRDSVFGRCSLFYQPGGLKLPRGQALCAHLDDLKAPWVKVEQMPRNLTAFQVRRWIEARVKDLPIY